MRTLHILNLGAGVQSTALFLMSLRQDEPEHVPRFDAAIFADTQEEPQAVYKHLEWLKSLGGPPIIEATAGRLGDDLLTGRNSTGQRFAPIPCYTKGEEDVRERQVQRQCTREYKTQVIEQAIRRKLVGLEPRQRMPEGLHVHQYMGLSFDEPRRVIRVRDRYAGIRWSTPHFPLFDMEISRRGCLAYLAEIAPGCVVPRSACVFCPYHSAEEWRSLRDNDPEGWERACQIDDALRVPGNIVNRQMDKAMFLHRSCVPLREAPIDTPESRGEQYTFGFFQECEGMCGL